MPSNSSHTHSAIVDRVAVMPAFRGQGITTASLEYIFTDIGNSVRSSGVVVTQFIFTLPLNSESKCVSEDVETILERKGFDLSDKTVQYVSNGVAYYHGILNL